MKYVAPYGSADPNAPYVDRDTPGAVRGSVPPAAAIEHSMREIVRVLTDRGFTPDADDLAQLSKAITWEIASVALQRLTSDRTFFVRTDGNDANDGGANTAGRAFKTLQGAYDAVRQRFYANGYSVTLQLGTPGTHAGLSHTQWPGAMRVRGDPASPSSYNIGQAPGSDPGRPSFFTSQSLAIEGVRVNPAIGGGGGVGRVVQAAAGTLTILNCDLVSATATLPMIIGESAARVTILGRVEVFSSAQALASMQSASALYLGDASTAYQLVFNGQGFGTATVVAQTGALIEQRNGAITGSATGPRAKVSTNAVINTAGGGANFFPGNSSIIQETGGQYV